MFTINHNDATPIFKQIVNQISTYIALGVLEEKDQLPSVRSLAKTLGINPNTVSKSYDEAERLNLIHSVRGVGSFVNEADTGLNSIKEKIYEDLNDNFKRLLNLGEQKNEIIMYLKENNND